MAQIKVLERYEIDLQAQPAKSFKGRDGEQVTMAAQVARRATVVVASYDEFTCPWILPESFDASKVKAGSVLHVDCPTIDKLVPMRVKNVNRVIEGFK